MGDWSGDQVKIYKEHSLLVYVFGLVQMDGIEVISCVSSCPRTKEEEDAEQKEGLGTTHPSVDYNDVHYILSGVEFKS